MEVTIGVDPRSESLILREGLDEQFPQFLPNCGLILTPSPLAFVEV